MQTLANFATISAAVAAMLAPFSMMLMGVVPRAGPGRAFALAVRSLVQGANIVSQRVDATSKLRGMLRNLRKDQFIVVSGQRASGSLSS